MRLKDCLRALKCRVWAAIDAVSLLGCHSEPEGGGVAIIRLDAIGDFVLWLDAAQHMRSLYPGKRLVLVANALWSDWAAEMGCWDEVWPVDPARLQADRVYRRQVMKDIRSRDFDVAIQPTYSRSFYVGDSLIRASQARQRIGSVGDESNITRYAKRISDRWYTDLMPARTGQLTESERNTEFLMHLAGREIPTEPSELPVGRNAQTVLSALPSNPFFVVFPGASHLGRQWPTSHWQVVAQQLHAKTQWTMVLCGSGADRAVCESIAAASQSPSVNLAGRTTLAELAEVLRRARLMVGNETSAVHIAAKLGVSSVCVLGGGHHGRFLPYPAHVRGIKPRVVDHPMPCYHCNWQCSQPHVQGQAFPCISAITPAQVLQAANSELSERTQQQAANKLQT